MENKVTRFGEIEIPIHVIVNFLLGIGCIAGSKGHATDFLLDPITMNGVGFGFLVGSILSIIFVVVKGIISIKNNKSSIK